MKKKEIENKLKLAIKKFNFPVVKQELEQSKLSHTEKIIMLKIAIDECGVSDLEIDECNEFISGCNMLIRHLNMYQAVQQEKKSQKKSQQSLTFSTKKGAKIDLIRILNAIYELELIVDANNKRPSKKDFMELIGNFFGKDLSAYSVNLSKALNENPLDTNIEIFLKMIEKTEQEYDKNHKKNPHKYTS